jgi:hypothetical protein
MKAGTPWDMLGRKRLGTSSFWRERRTAERSSCSLYRLRCRVKPKCPYFLQKNTQRDYYRIRDLLQHRAAISGIRKAPTRFRRSQG